MSVLHIRVPASSANLGPGFDTLAVAVNLHNRFEFQLTSSKETRVEIQRGIDPSMHGLCLEMIRAAARYFFKQTGVSETHFLLKIENDVPIARGLASSATLRLAVLIGLNETLRAGLSDQELVKTASELEVCTDNAAASFYGGLAASALVNGKLICYRFPVPETLDFIAVWPTESVVTEKARTVFPKTVPYEDAVFNLSRSTLLALAFAQHDFEGIADLMEDRLHQPYRQEKIPPLRPLSDVIRAAKSAGAFGGYLSGSGSTIMAIAPHCREEVGRAMQEAFAAHGMKTEVRYLKADNEGIRFERH